MSFDDRLQEGLAGESLIAKWLLRRGWNILPAYEKIQHNFKGPRIISAGGNLISPDMLAFRFDETGGEVHWIEAKSKAAFTWYRIGQTYQDGIDLHCWKDYIKLNRLAPWPVWLLFLHGPGEVAKDNPDGMTPPTGLFGNTIQVLRDCIDHESARWARGMVYWNICDLRIIAKWDDVVEGSQITQTPKTYRGTPEK